MRNSFKYALIFMSGVTVGVGICGIKVIGYAIERGYLQDAIAKDVFNKLNNKSQKSSTERFMYVENIVFETRDAAEQVFSDVLDMLKNYGCITVVDLYNIAGVASVNYMNTKYGWTSTNNFEILRTRKGYELRVPKALKIEYKMVN